MAFTEKTLAEDANVSLFLPHYKLEFIPGEGSGLANSGPANYHLSQLIDNEWQPVRFVQSFEFKISTDSVAGQVNIKLLDILE